MCTTDWELAEMRLEYDLRYDSFIRAGMKPDEASASLSWLADRISLAGRGVKA